MQVKNIPHELHQRIRHHARLNNRTVSAVVLTAVGRELERWEWQERLAHRTKTDLGVEVASLLEEVRSLHDTESQ